MYNKQDNLGNGVFVSMFAMIMTILCSTMLSVFMRMSEGKANGKMTILSANYLTCILLASCFTGVSDLFPSGREGFPITLVLGIVTGVFYMLTLVFNQKSIALNGVVLSSVFAKLGSLLVPLAVSLCFYGNTPSTWQIIGAVLAVISIIMITDNGQKGMAASVMLLATLLLVEGVSSAMGKIFDEEGAQALSDQYLFYTFGTALVISALAAIVKKEKPGLPELFYGVLIGVSNFFASRFMLQAVNQIGPMIFFPTRGVMVILLITLAGVFLFREKLQKKQWIAVGIILCAVALLNM